MSKRKSFYALLVLPVLISTSVWAQYQGIGQSSTVAKRAKDFAPKSLPSDLSRKIANILDVRTTGVGQLHPSGKSLYFTWRVTGTTQIWKVDGPLSFPVQLTGGEASTGLADISPDGSYLVVSRDYDGEENPGIYIQSANGGELLEIQHKPQAQTFYQFTSKDSERIYYRSNDRKQDSYALYRYHVKSKEKELIFDQPGRWFVVDEWQEEKIILGKAVTARAREYWELNLKTKEFTPLYGQGSLDEVSIYYLDNKDNYLLLTNQNSDFRELYVWNKKTTDLKPVRVKLDYEISSVNLNDRRDRVVIASNSRGRAKIEILSVPDFKSIRLPEFPGADHIYAGSWSKDGTQLMLAVETSTAPRMNYSLNVRSRKLTQWVQPSSPEVDTTVFVQAKEVLIPVRDGSQIPAFMRVPKKCEAQLEENAKVSDADVCPVVVHFHGGPEGQSRPGFSLFSQMFMEEGIIYLDPNVRGSTGYGKAYLDSDNGAKRLNIITDIEDVASYARKQLGAKKVGVFGWSYGGYSTLMAMTRFAGSYDVGVSLVGMSDLISFLNNTAAYRRALRVSEYGDPVKDKDALKKLSPLTYLDKVKSPLMIIQGLNDPRVPAGESVQIFDRLKKRKLDTQLILFPDEGHGTQKRANQVLELGHTFQFLKLHLKN